MAKPKWLQNLRGWWNSLAHIHILDRAGPDAVLFRTGNPASYSVFGIGGPEVILTELTQQLAAVANWSSDPARPPLITDLSLLTDETEAIEAERRAFAGDMVHWPTYGVGKAHFYSVCHDLNISECPSNQQLLWLSSSSRSILAQHFNDWDRDNINARVEEMHQRLTEAGAHKGGQRRGIILHCMCGCDRTGEMSIAYSMRYLNKSFTEALRESERVAGRHMIYQFQVAAQWYCEHLRTRGLYTGDDCGDCKVGRCLDDGHPMDAKAKAVIFRIVGIVLMCVVALYLSCACCPCCPAKRRRHGDYGAKKVDAMDSYPAESSTDCETDASRRTVPYAALT